MNKLITKIVGVSLGLALAAGVGVGVGLANNKSIEPALAGSATTSPIPNATNTGSSATSYLTADTSYTVGGVTYHVNSVNPSTLQLKCNAGSTSSTSASNFYMYNSSAMSGAIKSIAITFNGSVTANYWQMSVNSSNAISSNVSYNTDLAGTLASGTITWTYNASSNYKYFRLCVAKNGGTVKMTNMVITYDDGVSNPEMSVPSTLLVKKGDTKTLTVTYSNFTSGKTINAESDDTSVATVTSSATTSSTSGTLNFTVSGVSKGSATITISSSGVTSVTSTISVYEEQEFTKIEQAGRIVSGGHYLISRNGTSTVMSTKQNSSDRGSTTATPAGSSDFSTLTTENNEAAVIVITAGTGSYAGYYSLYDPEYVYNTNQGGYLEYYSGGLKTFHVSSGDPSGDYFYWSITFTDGHAVLANKSDSTYSIQFNAGTGSFKTYNSSQNAVGLYILSSEYVPDVDLSTISMDDFSVQNGSTIVVSGTYTPVNATEMIEATLTDDTLATIGEISMSNGTFSFSVRGDDEGSTTISFVGADGHGSETATLVVTAYTATHTLVEQASWLSDGTKVIIGCTDADYNFSAEKSTGGNNLKGVATGFASDKSSLSATPTSQEFVVWCVDATNHYYVFSDGGYYLTAQTGDNNYLKRTDVLSESCYFTLTAGANGVTVTSYLKNTYTLQFNSGSSIFSLYSAAQKTASLYKSSVAADTVQGFVDVFMHMDTYSSNSGYCSDETHHYYSDAKNAFTNTLSASERESFCTRSEYAAAYARLSAWAAANGDVINSSYELAQASRINLINGIGDNTTVLTVIVITAVLGFTTIGGYFLLRKKKEER